MRNQNKNKPTRKQQMPGMSKLPGGYVPVDVPTLEGGWPAIERYGMDGSVFVLHGALTENDTRTLVEFFRTSEQHASAGVSVAGFQVGEQHAATDGPAGSQRTTMWAPDLADQVWSIIGPYFSPRFMGPGSATDWSQQMPGSDLPAGHHAWLPTGCSPMMRFMRYEQGGQHYPHYDAGYFYPGEVESDNGKHRTLQSFVMYLTDVDATHGGATRFITDKRNIGKSIDCRNHDDWDRPADESEVLMRVQPEAGKVLVFDHRLCHDVEPYDPKGSGPRIIVRGDIIFTSIDTK